MPNDEPYLTFTQRNGLAPVPPQLKLGEVSPELRRLLDYYIGLEIQRVPHGGWDYATFLEPWERVAMDFHVLFLERSLGSFRNRVSELSKNISHIVNGAQLGRVFDLVEFFAGHPGCSDELRQDLDRAFTTARAAYRIVDGRVIAVGNEEQRAAFEGAVAAAHEQDAHASRKHLIASGAALRNSDWAGSVRESIHAVEATAIRLVPKATALSHALSALEKQGHLHGSLRAALSALYGYASDEKGVRHALVFKDEADVDEADALFMLGACASFVSYLLARERRLPVDATPAEG